jgi:fucose permease
VAGTALLWLDPAGVGALGLPLVGLSLAPVFPTLVSLTPVRLGNERAASAIGYQLSAAGIGAAALPGGVALAIDAGGLDTLGPALVTMAVVLLVLHHATEAVARPMTAGAVR